MTWTEVLVEISTYSALPAVLIGISYQVYRSLELKYAFYYTLGSLLADMCYAILWDVTSMAQYVNLLWQIIHLVTAGMFFTIICSKSNLRRWLLSFSLLGISLVLFDKLMPGFALTNNIINLIVVAYGIYYFYTLYAKEKEISLKKNSSLWIAIIFFFGHSGQVFSSLLSFQIANTFETYNLWSIVLVLNVMTNFTIGYAFLQKHRLKIN